MPTIKRDNRKINVPAPAQAARRTQDVVNTFRTRVNGSPRQEQTVTVTPKVRKPATKDRIRSAFNKTR